jgi:hypothetical protein
MEDIDVYAIDPTPRFFGELARNFLEIQRQKESFFESPEFTQLFGLISARQKVDDEGLLYNLRPVKGLSADNFIQVCDSVFHVLGESSRRIPGEFEHRAIDYKGVRFNLMIGQGAAYWTERISKG